MSTATIHIPGDHIQAVRASLRARRQDLEHTDDTSQKAERLQEIDVLLEQLHAARDARQPVTGAHGALWNAAYDALCVAAERLAEDCAEIWRGSVDCVAVHKQLAVVTDRLALLDSLGVPPDDAGRN